MSHWLVICASFSKDPGNTGSASGLRVPQLASWRLRSDHSPSIRCKPVVDCLNEFVSQFFRDIAPFSSPGGFQPSSMFFSLVGARGTWCRCGLTFCLSAPCSASIIASPIASSCVAEAFRVLSRSDPCNSETSCTASSKSSASGDCHASFTALSAKQSSPRASFSRCYVAASCCSATTRTFWCCSFRCIRCLRHRC